MSLGLMYGDVLEKRVCCPNVTFTYRYRMDPVPKTRQCKPFRKLNTGIKQKLMVDYQWLEYYDKPMLFRNEKRKNLWDSDPYCECLFGMGRHKISWKLSKRKKQWDK